VNTAGASGNLRMGIYTSDHSGVPTFTLLKIAGIASVATTGLKTLSSMSQAIAAGKIVYLALLCDVSWVNLGTSYANLGKPIIGGNSGGFNFGNITGYSKAAAYSSGLPTSVTGVSAVQVNCPTIGMRL
jgi:hypothetical protein